MEPGDIELVRNHITSPWRWTPEERTVACEAFDRIVAEFENYRQYTRTIEEHYAEALITKGIGDALR